MGINQLILSPEMVAALYPESLVAAETPALQRSGDPEKPALPGYSFMGGNLRFISIIAADAFHEFLPAPQLVFLEKMLNACKCTLADVAILNQARTPVQFPALQDQLNPKIIFLWGVAAESVGLGKDFKDFVIYPIGSISAIYVPSPDILTGSSAEGLELKQRLWAALKKIFNL